MVQSKPQTIGIEMIETIRKEIPQEEFDYQTLLNCLKDYARPRDKISDLLHKGVIIRVKKGLYVFGEGYRSKPYSREILANLIYGPSYISLDYALQHHALIPERVEAVTSVSTGRSRRFSTPVGVFTYRMIPLQAYRIGMDRVEIGDGRAFLMATPEKALADKLYDGRGTGIKTQKELTKYLEESLRIDPAALRDLRPTDLHAIAQGYRSQKIRLLRNLVSRIHRKTEKEKVDA
jgi:predicted transcriptional regulator of viral defense system